MTKACAKFRDQILEAALGEAPDSELEAHLSGCADCAAELSRLRLRRERMDALLPRIAGAAEPSPDLRARVRAAVQATAPREPRITWWRWALAGAAAAVIVVVMMGWVFRKQTTVPENNLSGAQVLARWHAPTDVFLQASGHELLNSVPKLGESYLAIPATMEKGENK